MVDAGQERTEELAIGDDAADRNAAEAGAVITALAADEPGARRFAAQIVVGKRDLERGVDGFRTGIAEEHPIEIARRQRRNAARQLKRLRMGELEGRRIIELLGLTLDRCDDRIAAMPGIGAPQPGGAIEHGAALRREVMHVLGARDQPRRAFERAVRRKRQPVGFEIVGLASQYRLAARARHARSLPLSYPLHLIANAGQSVAPPAPTASSDTRSIAPAPDEWSESATICRRCCAKLNSDCDVSWLKLQAKCTEKDSLARKGLVTFGYNRSTAEEDTTKIIWRPQLSQRGECSGFGCPGGKQA